MYVETSFGIYKPMFVTNVVQHWADMCNFIVCCQYDCLFDISEIFVQYCPDIRDIAPTSKVISLTNLGTILG